MRTGATLQSQRLRQLVEQRLCLFQIRRVEALGEPAVDGGEQVAGFGGLALGLPEACEVGQVGDTVVECDDIR